MTIGRPGKQRGILWMAVAALLMTPATARASQSQEDADRLAAAQNSGQIAQREALETARVAKRATASAVTHAIDRATTQFIASLEASVTSRVADRVVTRIGEPGEESVDHR